MLHGDGQVAVWRPSVALTRQSAMALLLSAVRQLDPSVVDYPSLHRYSVEQYRAFWHLWLQRSGVIYAGDATLVRRGDAIEPPAPGAGFFPHVRLNFAENLLRRRDKATAVVCLSEMRAEVRWTFAQLYADVQRVRAFLQRAGITSSDVVAGWMPNIGETLVVMLAAASLGAAWASVSPEFGVAGAYDRLAQIAPKVLLTVGSYKYAGKTFLMGDKNAALLGRLAAVTEVLHVPLGPHGNAEPGYSQPTTCFDDLPAAADAKAPWPRFAFDHPLYILFTSGTTGAPKCLIHGAGGTLLQHAKEHQLHADIRPGDNLLYYTTCSWMMWNWAVSALFSGCQLTLFDGSPTFPAPDALWRVVGAHGVTHFGSSAKYLSQLSRQNLIQKPPAALRAVLSTGSPLSPEVFDWAAQALHGVQLASICGGTDIVSCFMLGNPLLPIFRGEIAAFGLGMDVCVIAPDGQPVQPCDKGELCCKTPFVSMPVAFMGDPEAAVYRQSYFATFAGMWAQGDFISVTGSAGRCGGVIVHGRSDTTLKPGGVRIGTAEIYRLLDSIDALADSIVVGQPMGADMRILLFVVLSPPHVLDGPLLARIRTTLRAGATPRHVPARIVQVPSVPYTPNGKKMERAVLLALSGAPLPDPQTMQDPHALRAYVALAPTLSGSDGP